MSDYITISTHVEEERWEERSDQPLRDPLEVGYEAVEIDPCETEADEVRYPRARGPCSSS